MTNILVCVPSRSDILNSLNVNKLKENDELDTILFRIVVGKVNECTIMRKCLLWALEKQHNKWYNTNM